MLAELSSRSANKDTVSPKKSGITMARIKELLYFRPLLLKQHCDMPKFCRERHIYTGYRPNPSSVAYCVRSMFHPTNETFNFWTHFVPLIFLVMRRRDLSSALDFDCHEVATLSAPYFAYSLGCCVLLLCSSIAHLFNCVSIQARHLCFCIDYGAISFYSIAATVAYSHLVSPPHCHGFDAGSSTLYIPTSAATVVLAHIVCCHTRFPHIKYRYVLRTVTYAVPFVLISLPTMMRMSNLTFNAASNETLHAVDDSHPESRSIPSSCGNAGALDDFATTKSTKGHCDLASHVFPTYYPAHLLLFLLAAIINVSRFPEKYFPRVFDVVGSSHQWFHIAIALGIIVQSFIVEEAMFDAIDSPGILHSATWLSNINFLSTMGWLVSVSAILVVTVLIYTSILPC